MTLLPTPFDAGAVSPCSAHDAATDGAASPADHLSATRYRFVPDEMRAGRWWMVTRGKAPHRVTHGGGQLRVIGADWTDPENHCSFAEAMEAISAEPALNLMLMLGFGNEFVCVDIDPLEKVAPDRLEQAMAYQKQLRERLNHTYSEVSLSGKGTHFVGIARPLVPGTRKTQHPEYKTDLLFNYGLVLTGDHRAGTTQIEDISSQVRAIQTHMESGDGSTPAPVALLPSDDIITPGTITDAKRLWSILSAGKNGDAFRDGRKTADWSGTYKAILNAAAQFCTDERIVRQVIQTSGLVQLAEEKDGVSRADKVDRLWDAEWRDSLIKTEKSRREAAADTVDTGPKTLADLWDSKQSGYVRFKVQYKAENLITEGIYRGSDAETLAPLFRYLTPERQNSLCNTLRYAKKDDLAKLCLDACIIAQTDTDTEVPELNAYIGEMIAEESRNGFQARFKEYNSSYYIIENFGGAVAVFHDAVDPDTGAQDMWRLAKFLEARNSEHVLISFDLSEDKPQVERFARIWCESPKARRYARQEMRFDTTDRVIDVGGKQVLNLFHGWATTPVAGEWPAIRYLIHELLCSGVPEASEYLLNYVAHMVQKPHVLPGTAVILQSEEQGTGKSTFISLLRQLLGSRYCATTSDAEHLVGKHNDRAMNKVLLHFEEAVAPNDRKVESKVKALITDEMGSYNPKNMGVVQARNYARVFMTSNAQQVAHIARHDRRMFVLNVSPKHANDAGFWSQFHTAFPQEMEAFMHAMRTRDISEFRPNVIPFTEAKDKQKLESVVGPDRVLRDLLEAGRLPACSYFDGREWEVRVSALSDYFIKNGIKVGHSFPQPARVFAPVALSPVRVRRIAVNGAASKSWRVISVPRLADARSAFLKHQNIAAYDWGDGMDDWALD
ncbi:hypothetical protein IQ03_05181 [Gemmobacter caeni]|uniref:NrS-1 polymerase-like helicase domain-containing protein n=1 Tax=Gemmobacter caeni TaxID=589035 RepID=A0A2T6A3J8_9RHOB|nr:primase-helicase family protein [Gemmobacter caeni]PTX38383.1 hypothetical protein C8N34_1447 [Gemmobacter caeni]TWI89802.1 hypothetical protein IQ03_05181 [Gemmobacter caeni]